MDRHLHILKPSSKEALSSCPPSLVRPPISSAVPQTAMAAALHSFASLGNPSPNPRRIIRRTAVMLGLSPLPSLSRHEAPRIWCAATVPGLHGSTYGRFPRSRHLVLDRRFSLHATFAAPQEDSMYNEMDGESVKGELGVEANEPLEAWKQMLESFKEDAIKMQSVSQEAYDIYSKRAMVVLKETSENMKIQADQARRDLSKLAEVIGKEGQEYLSTAAKNSPESVKDIVETFASSHNKLNDLSEVRDFYLGIPYGGFLAIGGFLHFMLTGNVSGIRFGVILGGILLALSVSSLRAWRSDRSSTIFLKGQASITAVIFIREWNLLSRVRFHLVLGKLQTQ
uniref:Biotin synthase n=1 Tax=Anthurium amnicola TaxID=1678845 RepID=A0A1D1ZIH9_9ARAE